MTEKYRKRTLKGIIIALAVLVLAVLCSACAVNKRQFYKLSDLSGKTIAVESGTIHAALIKENEEIKNPQIRYVTNNSDMIGTLLRGKTDAMVTDRIVAMSLEAKYPELLMLNARLDDSTYGFGFQKGNELCKKFSSHIRQFKRSGKQDSLINKWTCDDASVKVPEKYDIQNYKGKLKCMVNAEYEPVCYKNSKGEIIGYDIDVLNMIASELGYEVEYIDVTFDELVPSVVAGECDIIASGITITEERKEMIDFTDSYQDVSAVILVRDESAVTGIKGTAISVANSFRRTILENERWLQILKGLLVTLEVIIITIITSFLLGFILFLIAYSGNRHFIAAANGFAHFMTLMPLYSWFLVVYYIMFTSNTSGNMIIAIIALTIETGIFVYMNLMDAVSQVPEGEKEAVYTMGYRKYQGLFKIILPQARTKFLSLMADDIIVHVRGTSLVGTVAVMDLQAVSDLITAETMEPFMPLAITVLAYAGLAELACRGVKKIMHMLDKTERTEEEIRKSIMEGRF